MVQGRSLVAACKESGLEIFHCPPLVTADTEETYSFFSHAIRRAHAWNNLSPLPHFLQHSSWLSTSPPFYSTPQLLSFSALSPAECILSQVVRYSEVTAGHCWVVCVCVSLGVCVSEALNQSNGFVQPSVAVVLPVEWSCKLVRITNYTHTHTSWLSLSLTHTHTHNFLPLHTNVYLPRCLQNKSTSFKPSRQCGNLIRLAQIRQSIWRWRTEKVWMLLCSSKQNPHSSEVEPL